MFFSPNDLNSSETLINHRCAEVKNLNDSPKALTNIPNGEIARQTKRLKQNSKQLLNQIMSWDKGSLVAQIFWGDLMNTHRQIDILCVVGNEQPYK